MLAAFLLTTFFLAFFLLVVFFFAVFLVAFLAVFLLAAFFVAVFLRPRPLGGGAASNRATHSSRVKLAGSFSLGIFAFLLPSVT